MSSIRWHFPDGTLSMGGRERGWFGCICTDIATMAIRLRLPNEYVMRDVRWLGHDFLRPQWFGSLLETVWVTGSRPVRLVALIHGWCETNLVLDGSAFGEVADALEEGLALGIFRPETQRYEGVERIIERLRKGGDWCVWSYSVTDGFPLKDPETDPEDPGYLTEEQSVAVLRARGHVEAAGVLQAPTRTAGEASFWTMDVARLVELVGPP